MSSYQKTLKKVIANFCYLILLFGSHLAFTDTITIWGEYHPPLNGSPEDSNPGFMIEIAESILKRNGHTIKYTLGSRARGVQMVREGEIDCVVNAKVKDHNFLAFPNEPWGYHAATLFALPESEFQYRDIRQLKNIRLGAIAEMRYDNGPLDDYLKEKKKNVSFSYGDDAMSKQIKKLGAGRTDLIVSCPLLLRGQLESMNLPRQTFRTVGEVKPFVGMYFACENTKQRTKEIINNINIAIPIMRKNGELKSILDKYGQIDWIDIHKSLDSAQ